MSGSIAGGLNGIENIPSDWLADIEKASRRDFSLSAVKIAAETRHTYQASDGFAKVFPQKLSKVCALSMISSICLSGVCGNLPMSLSFLC
jgi:hypothetical protein